MDGCLCLLDLDAFDNLLHYLSLWFEVGKLQLHQASVGKLRIAVVDLIVANKGRKGIAAHLEVCPFLVTIMKREACFHLSMQASLLACSTQFKFVFSNL